MEEVRTIWTIGHSTHDIGKFIEMLRSFGIETLVDIRTYPGSKRNPQYNTDELARALREAGITYTHMTALGGRRRPNPESMNSRLTHPAFRAYADYMETPEFRDGIAELTTLASQYHTVYMCAESVWWKCHRSMVSDYMKSIGWTVMHIMDAGKAKEHPYTSAANIVEGQLSYKGLL